MPHGAPEAGLTALAEAMTLVEATEERWWEAEVYRLQGALLLQLPLSDEGQAEACFQQALDVARRQQAKSLELRAALSLSCLWQGQGKRAAARQLLAEIYDWFTEGLDTADLQDAETLLEAGAAGVASSAGQPRARGASGHTLGHALPGGAAWGGRAPSVEKAV
jgi:predicted ATPase